jgi:putative tryptophan/tyrosine transport system substrate-binding protein
MRRREFVAVLGAATAWPVGVSAQQPSIPVIGFVTAGNGPTLSKWLMDFGYVEGRNLNIEYRWAATDFERQREFAADLVRRQVAVILAAAPGPALAAKRATSTIPVVFLIGDGDPVELGLVASINRPGGNVTGVGFNDLTAKRLDLLCQLVPTATSIAYLSGGPRFIAFRDERPIVIAATDALGRQLIEVECPSKDRLAQSFRAIVERGASAVFVSQIPLFNNNAGEIVNFAALHKIPAMYPNRGYTSRGGLVTYAHDPEDAFRVAVGLVVEILKGAKPADLPVRNSTKFDFVINLQTARVLGLKVPPMLLALADKVIE